MAKELKSKQISNAEILGESPIISILPAIIEPIEVEQEDVPNYCNLSRDELYHLFVRGVITLPDYLQYIKEEVIPPTPDEVSKSAKKVLQFHQRFIDELLNI